MRHEEAIGPNSPLYLQLRELIRGKIEGGEYPPGTAIPSVGTLAETYGIHRLSVRSAISALIGEGLLKSVQGKGIFVVGDKLERDLETVGGFRQNMQAKPESRVLVKALRPAGVVYGALLSCAPGEPVHYIKPVSYTHLDVYKRQVTTYLKLITAVIVALAIAAPALKDYFLLQRRKRAALSERRRGAC